MLKGIIFDFDGVIIDTEMPRYLAWKSIFEEYGAAFSMEQWQLGVGTGPSAFDPAVLLCEVTNGKAEITSTEVLADQLALDLVKKQPLLPGVEEFIINAKQVGVKLAVASSSSREWVVGNLQRIGLYSVMEAVCTAEDVERVKPDPALYLLALQSLGLSAAECVAFEDSTNGILAATRAGLKCIAIPNRMTADMDFSLAHKIVNTFFQIKLQEL